MTLYGALLFLHIAASTVWVGGAAMVQVFGLRAGLGGPERRHAFAEDAAVVGKLVLTPSSFLVMLSGIGLVVEGPWTFDQDWITIAIVLYAIGFVAGAGFFGPESGRIGALMARGEREEGERRVRRLIMLTRIDLALLFLILFDMALKPDLDDGGVLVTGVIGFGVAVTAIVWRSLAPAPRPAAATGD